MDIGQRGFKRTVVSPGIERSQEAGRVRAHVGCIGWLDERDQDAIGLAAWWLFRSAMLVPS